MKFVEFLGFVKESCKATKAAYKKAKYASCKAYINRIDNPQPKKVEEDNQ